MKDPIKRNKTNYDQISIQTLLSSNHFVPQDYLKRTEWKNLYKSVMDSYFQVSTSYLKSNNLQILFPTTFF